MKNISAALEYMHSEGYIHRDLTSSNLLVTDGYEAKVRVHTHSQLYQAQICSLCELSTTRILNQTHLSRTLQDLHLILGIVSKDLVSDA